MNRQSINGGGWIDLDTAKKFAEDREVLYRSVGGVYVLHTWSQWQGSQDTWERIGIDQAVEWLLRNGYDPESPAEEIIAAKLEV